MLPFRQMELIEAEFNEGVLRPMRRLRLRPGERVGIVVVRRPDPSRWDLVRLSRANPDEDGLTEVGLAEWEATLSREDQS
jgi:predicted DNA-binding antitoxin AbrB/MazE fold protein